MHIALLSWVTSEPIIYSAYLYCIGPPNHSRVKACWLVCVIPNVDLGMKYICKHIKTLETHFEVLLILLEKFWWYMQNQSHPKMNNQPHRNLKACPWERWVSTSLFVLVQSVHQWSLAQFLEVPPSFIKPILRFCVDLSPYEDEVIS